ncbi:hypothetical protein FGG78_11915 [Thioclava sp. BHET1]|nr:hypothetical protein FGG78_11915 [Thioclava sp. BHET1]
MNDQVFTTLASGILGALLLLSYQIWKDRSERREREKDRERQRRMAVIADLVGSRYVLTPGRANPRGVAAFNQALNRIPVEFIGFRSVTDKYRAIGHNFTAEKFHELVIAMVNATAEYPEHFDYDILASAPSATYNPPEFGVIDLCQQQATGSQGDR